MNPVYHARSSQHRYGGHWRDYIAVHSLFDQSKFAFPSVQHRVFLHTTDFGRAVALAIFGEWLTLSDGNKVGMESLVRQHIREDLGFRVTMDDWLAKLEAPDWLKHRSRRRVPNDIARFGEEPLEAAANTWGGQADEYAPVLDVLMLPMTLSSHPLAEVITHNSLGIFLVEAIVGPAIETKDGHIVPTRLVAERMVNGRMRTIPTPQGIAGHIAMEHWMHGALVKDADRLWPDDDHDHHGGHG